MSLEKMKIQKVLFILISGFALFALSGCATLCSKKQTVTVTCDVNGAAVYKGKKYVGVTPCTFRTKVAKNTITVTKDGMSHTINTDIKLRGNVLWNIFNCWVGWPIDGLIGTTQKYGITDYYVSFLNPAENVAWNSAHPQGRLAKNKAIADAYMAAYWENMTPEERARKEQKAAETGNAILQALGAVVDGVAQGQAEYNRRHAAEQAAKEAERQEFRSRYMNNNSNSSNYQQSQRNNSVNSGTTSSYNSSGSYSQQSQSVPREWLTSDPEWNRAVQMSVQQYGLEATRKMIEQKRNNDRTEYDGQVITGMTSSGAAVKLKVKDGRVVAFARSTGFGTDYIQWEKAGATIYGSSRFSGYNKSDFKYAADVIGLGVVFFDL